MGRVSSWVSPGFAKKVTLWLFGALLPRPHYASMSYFPGSFSGSPYSTPQVSTRMVAMT